MRYNASSLDWCGYSQIKLNAIHFIYDRRQFSKTVESKFYKKLNEKLNKKAMCGNEGKGC